MLLDRIFQTRELRDAPPVLVDVGAAGGVTPIWRAIARYSIGVGFEPDARDSEKLSAQNSVFKRWVYCDRLVAPKVESGGMNPFYLTRSPHCSSLLKPRNDLLRDWCFADLFEMERIDAVAAVTLRDALSAAGLRGVDWLKCDTQGLDLSIFLSLPVEWRRAMLAVEFEPGLIDAYEGEDKLWRTLQAMEAEPFWICDLEVVKYPRGKKAPLRAELGAWTDKWLPRLAPPSPTHVNMRYLRDLGRNGETLDRRAFLLSWVFADLLGQHAQGVIIARDGRERFGAEFFEEMRRVSRRRLIRSMLRQFPRWLTHRLGLSA
jgi:FkbM family methyltransferase